VGLPPRTRLPNLGLSKENIALLNLFARPLYSLEARVSLTNNRLKKKKRRKIKEAVQKWRPTTSNRDVLPLL
jgi:hypothetical protein